MMSCSGFPTEGKPQPAARRPDPSLFLECEATPSDGSFEAELQRLNDLAICRGTKLKQLREFFNDGN